MKLVENDDVRGVAGQVDLVDTLRKAFLDSATGKTALQPRQRISSDALKLSTMAAILPESGVAGAKVYTTLAGRFAFVILLFDAKTGVPLACMESDVITEVRTAAVSTMAAMDFGPENPEVLTVFGTGLQGRSHILEMAARLPLREVRVVSRGDAGCFCDEVSAEIGVPVAQVTPETAVPGADIVVTATRSQTPLFDGDQLGPNAFVAAVGSTLPTAREVDGRTIARASTVLIEDRDQSFAEAGGLILAEQEGALDRGKVMTIGQALTAPGKVRPSGEGIVVFESVGIALEDVAIAAAIFRALPS
ncbi:ornithine cyclodeaminase family protein [Oceanibium sediminis]|uniref:ornithine cyclodeaminase family protein n=1 Tax=Oceanibium sediminis TaxID=2026339 RepID=UPI000DD3795E|nr:ornithine cyclodeaminase family protein [Oceanibium sediminis]